MKKKNHEIKVFECNNIEEAEAKFYEMSSEGWRIIKPLQPVWSWKKFRTVIKFSMKLITDGPSTSPEIRLKIQNIIKERYNNYEGKFFKPLKPLHQIIRIFSSDAEFLEFLKESEKNNPKPVYKLNK